MKKSRKMKFAAPSPEVTASATEWIAYYGKERVLEAVAATGSRELLERVHAELTGGAK